MSSNNQTTADNIAQKTTESIQSAASSIGASVSGTVNASTTSSNKSTTSTSSASRTLGDDDSKQQQGIEAGQKVKQLGEKRDASQADKDAAYEERMEDEYAKREGGA